MSLEILGLSTRARNCLRRAGLRPVAEVAALTDEQLLGIRSLGKLTLAEIREKLTAYLKSHPLSEQDQPSKLPAAPRLTTPAEPEPTSPSTDQSRVPENTPIVVLGLSVRPYNALVRGGVTTVGQLARMSSEQILGVRNVGAKSLAEIEEKLEAYLAEHPLSSPEPNALVEPEPVLPLVAPALLARAAQIPLDDISIERLALPTRWGNQFHRRGIESVGELARQPADAVDQDPSVGKQLERYLTWLVEQDEATWADEVAGRGVSPLHRLMLAETTLDDLVERWLGPLSDRERRVLEWRYGLDCEPLTLEEVGQRLDVTRERVRQIQTRALSRLANPNGQRRVRELTAHLLQAFRAAGGLMTEAEVGRVIAEAVAVNDTDAEWVGRLWLATRRDVRQLKREAVWGLADAPLRLVPDVNRRLVRLMEPTFTSLTDDELLAEFKRTRFYEKHRSRLPDGFLHACLRTNQAIEITDGQCRLVKWARRRTPVIVQTLREIGEPAHYTIITKRANALLPPELQATPHNVHAELGRRTDLFVRVGHGIFGLKEWDLPDDGSLANAAYRVLTEAGHPLHIEAITDRVLETWRVERSSVHAAVFSDDRLYRAAPATFGLTEWEIERLEEAQPVLNICPPPLPDRRGERGTFFESVLVARGVLRERPTTTAFLRTMLKWVGTELEKSDRYLQNVLNAYYVVGLIPYTVYRHAADAPLHSTLPETDDLQALRRFCLNCMMERLARMPEFMVLLATRQPCTATELTSEFHIDIYAIRTARDEVLSRLRILKSLGVVTLISEARYRLTHFGEVEAARVGHSLPDSPFISDTALPEISPSTDIGWLDAAL
ncbi:MAG: hypothetical protein DRI48_06795 [Chloroflexi bacterium]|nr:MAG: hypothetical protein DRI48_06795 [Chloroflexota bacterium]